jgi:D-alanyl-lipoteichoic acid acyltransferase DltB (MBOAT superfamily)
MLFNSFEFLAFLPTVFILYWFVVNRSLKLQNILLLIASYIFYGWWDYRFLALIALSTLIDYAIGLLISKSENDKSRKLLVTVSVIANLTILGFFKYFNFFIDSWQEILQSFGYQSEHTWTLKIMLPVGISFYTFQTMSYTIDIYRRQLAPTKDLISFATFVSFFPQLVAGPIEKASKLLPQILKKRAFNYEQGAQGARLLIWGMFKKVVIADSLAPHVYKIFTSHESFDGGALVMGAMYATLQLYCDFSGYSDIAIGTSKLFGVELSSNFKFPVFSKDLVQVWSKWHISLTTWFRDYVFKSLGGLKVSKNKIILNVCIVFLASGLWHGADWKYVMWGGIHALLFLLTLLLRKKIKLRPNSALVGKVVNLIKIFSTFFLMSLTLVLFRAENVNQAGLIYVQIIEDLINNQIVYDFHVNKNLLLVTILLAYDYAFRKDERNIFQFGKIPRRLSYLFMIMGIIAFFNDQINFLYFQF